MNTQTSYQPRYPWDEGFEPQSAQMLEIARAYVSLLLGCNGTAEAFFAGEALAGEQVREAIRQTESYAGDLGGNCQGFFWRFQEIMAPLKYYPDSQIQPLIWSGRNKAARSLLARIFERNAKLESGLVELNHLQAALAATRK